MSYLNKNWDFTKKANNAFNKNERISLPLNQICRMEIFSDFPGPYWQFMELYNSPEHLHLALSLHIFYALQLCWCGFQSSHMYNHNVNFALGKKGSVSQDIEGQEKNEIYK